MKSTRANSQLIAVVLVYLAAASGLAANNSKPPSPFPGQSDQQSVNIANASLVAMGGEEAWNTTRYIS